MRRDVTRLRSLGYPVDADAGHGGGYHLGHGGRLPPLLLDDEEAVAVAGGLRVATTTNERDRDAWRTFRIDRIVAPALTGHRYRFDDPPDPVVLVAEGTGVVPWEIEARVLVACGAPSRTDARRLAGVDQSTSVAGGRVG